jgi:hypothetical protein
MMITVLWQIAATMFLLPVAISVLVGIVGIAIGGDKGEALNDWATALTIMWLCSLKILVAVGGMALLFFAIWAGPW